MHMLRLERGMGPLPSLKASDGYSVAVQSGRAAAHTNGAARKPQAATR